MVKQRIVSQRIILHMKADKSEESGHIERFVQILK